MPSLEDAYRRPRLDRDPRRLVAGAVACLVGSFAIAVAVLLVATPLGAVVFGSATQARLIAGVGGGCGLPAVLVGLVAVLPTDRAERIGVAVGGGICLVGVALFWTSYPGGWGPGGAMAFPTLVTYFVGGTGAFVSVLWALATYRVRNRPGSAIHLEIQRPGTTRSMSVSRAEFERYRRLIERGEDARVLAELDERAG